RAHPAPWCRRRRRRRPARWLPRSIAEQGADAPQHVEVGVADADLDLGRLGERLLDRVLDHVLDLDHLLAAVGAATTDGGQPAAALAPPPGGAVAVGD